MNKAFKNLKHSFESGRPAHAYMVIGNPRSEGRVFVEKALGLILKTHTHPDILWVEPQKKSRKISIEQVRNLQHRIFQTSFSGGWKACVLVGADRLGVQASNAFLKTLEEPPRESIFFLLTDSPQFLLPTIISRCQRIIVSTDHPNLPDTWRERLVMVLTNDRLAYRPANIAAAFARADHLVKFLKEIKESIKTEEQEKSLAAAPDEEDDTLEARINSRYREARTMVICFLLQWYRDILLLLCGADNDFVFNDGYLDFLKNKAKGLTFRQALYNVQVIEAVNRQLERNLSEGPVLSFGFSRLA